MPTYIYKNPNTGETFEIKQSIREDALTVHPDTGEPIKRMIQPVGIAFKGSGFYVNDSKSKNPASSAKTSDSSANDSSAKDATSKDTSASGASTDSSSKSDSGISSSNDTSKSSSSPNTSSSTTTKA